jgi:hypothetical protein
MSRSYEAFRVQRIHDGTPGGQRVESLCCWKEYLVVGLQDGAMLLLREEPGAATWQVRHSS